MTMKIEFTGGEVLAGGPQTCTIVLPCSVIDNLRQALTYMALLEAKQGHSEFANDLLWIENEIANGIVS